MTKISQLRQIKISEVVNRKNHVFLPSSSILHNDKVYINFLAERTGVSFYPHQVEGAGSIPASAKMENLQ